MAQRCEQRVGLLDSKAGYRIGDLRAAQCDVLSEDQELRRAVEVVGEVGRHGLDAQVWAQVAVEPRLVVVQHGPAAAFGQRLIERLRQVVHSSQLRFDEEPLWKSGLRIGVGHVEVQVRGSALPGVPNRDAGDRRLGIVSA